LWLDPIHNSHFRIIYWGKASSYQFNNFFSIARGSLDENSLARGGDEQGTGNISIPDFDQDAREKK
jgi:hypothetical protein